MMTAIMGRFLEDLSRLGTEQVASSSRVCLGDADIFIVRLIVRNGWPEMKAVYTANLEFMEARHELNKQTFPFQR